MALSGDSNITRIVTRNPYFLISTPGCPLCVILLPRRLQYRRPNKIRHPLKSLPSRRPLQNRLLRRQSHITLRRLLPILSWHRRRLPFLQHVRHHRRQSLTSTLNTTPPASNHPQKPVATPTPAHTTRHPHSSAQSDNRQQSASPSSKPSLKK